MVTESRSKKFSKSQASRDWPLIPGTYQIHITRVNDTGKQKHFIAYVPTSLSGVKELVRRQFRGIPQKYPAYFMKHAEFKSL